MAMPIFTYRVPAALYLSALIAFLALAGLAVPMALEGRISAAVLIGASGLAGLSATVALWLRKRAIVFTVAGLSLPAGPFASQSAFVPFRHILNVGIEKRTGGQVLTILHRNGKAVVPASNLPRANDVHHLRDVLSQQMNQIAGRARPINWTARALAAPYARPQAQKAAFGRRGARG